MGVSDVWPVQQAVFAAIETALAGESIPVFDHMPHEPPVEHVRIDGFGLTTATRKNSDSGPLGFQVNFFHRPDGGGTGARGNKRVFAVLSAIHDQLKVTRPQGKPLQLRYMDATPDPDGVTQHGMLRYTIEL